MALKFDIQGQAYTQKSARARCSEVLNKHSTGSSVHGEDFYFLKESFEKYHYDTERKIPSPIKSINVRKSASGSNNEFWIAMLSGQECSIGFSIKCFVTAKGADKIKYEDNVKDAARCHIRKQQDDARNHFIASGNLTCSLCQKTVPHEELHADHSHPNTFKHIFEQWLKKMDLRFEDIEYCDVVASSVRRFKDDELAVKWVDYHKGLFQPQPTHARCNLQQG